MSGLLSRTRLFVAGLAIVALVLGTLIYRDMFVPTKSAGSALSLYTVARRTVTASVTGSGNVEPQQQANVNFKVAGELTAIYVHVGDHVSAGQTLATIDSSAEQTALAQAQANLATAEANQQSVATPLTQDQITQLQDAVTTAQQAYNDTVTQVNLTNSQDAAQVAADQTQFTLDQQTLQFNSAYQTGLQTLSTDQATLTTALNQFKNDGCNAQTFGSYTAQCQTDYTNVQTAQTKVAADQSAINACCMAQVNQYNTDSAKLAADKTKQTNDQTSGQRSINQAAASLTSAQDNLKTQTESKPNQIASANAGVLSAQAAVASAQQNLANTTLTSPMDGQVNSINGVVGETVSPGGGTTAEAPGSQAPLPTATTSNAFMVIGNISGLEVVIPFAESDASRLAANDDTQVTFDAVPNLTISGHVIAVGSDATVTSGVVNYYATIVLNKTDPSLKQGMTANATVTVSKSTNALSVPNLAITHTGGQAYVTVYASGQQVITPIDTGIVGDQYTEVVGGLNNGEQIVLPTIRAATATGTTGGRGFGGGGGIRVGAGG